MSGTELQRARETAADIMRQKQAAGKSSLNCLQFLLRSSIFFFHSPFLIHPLPLSPVARKLNRFPYRRNNLH